jgi:acetylcholinesterase
LYRKSGLNTPHLDDMAPRAATPLLEDENSGRNSPALAFGASTPSSAPLLPLDEPAMKNFGYRRRTFWTRNRRRILIGIFIVGTLALLGSILAPRKWKADPTLRLPDEPVIVKLPGYGSFRGTKVIKNRKNIVFDEPIDAWLGIDYSTQPVGKQRFGLPGWPKEFTETRNATQYGKACMQNWGWNPQHHTEACLTFNVFRPQDVPFDQKLPVFVFFHGGSFVVGDGKSLDGATFVSKSKEPLMVVTAQYRLGALGSLPSKLFQEEGLLNLGVQDQRQLLEFLQEYLKDFGGDADRVTIGGQSAGAHAVGLHLFHDYGDTKGKKLFSQAIIASGAPTARSFPGPSYALNERYYDEFMTHVQCPRKVNSTNAETLECLRSVPMSKLRLASGKTYTASNYNITWPWQPSHPGSVLEKSGSQSGIDGTFFKIPLLISSVTDEGKMFAPKDLQSNAQFVDFMANLLPGLTQSDLRELDVLYSDPSNGEGPYANHVGKVVSTQFERISAAYGDYSYICPVQETAHRLAVAGAPVYKARFNTPNGASPHMGVPHASDHGYFNGHVNTQFPEISEIYHSYYASFVVSGDPNTHKSVKAPKWDRYWHEGSAQLAVSNAARGGVVMEEERKGIRMQECKWWRDEARMKRLNK